MSTELKAVLSKIISIEQVAEKTIPIIRDDYVFRKVTTKDRSFSILVSNMATSTPRYLNFFDGMAKFRIRPYIEPVLNHLKS